MFCLLLAFLLLTFGHYGQAVDECGCPVLHPQQAFCNSDFAIMVTIESGSESPLPFEAEDAWNGFMVSHYRYNATVRDTYMPENTTLEEGDSIFIYTPNDWCGRLSLEYMEEYVISGTIEDVVDPDSGYTYPILMMSKCEITMKFMDMTEQQMMGITTDYRLYCDQCPILGVRGEQTLQLNHVFETLPEVATNFWTLDMGCYFNPAASVHNLVKDCETELSHCRYDALLGKCGWDMNAQFTDCFKERGLTVMYRHDKNAAAVQRASDCKYLQNRRLKKKCVRAFRRSRNKGRGRGGGRRQ